MLWRVNTFFAGYEYLFCINKFQELGGYTLIIRISDP
jgi:hypothetical protein